MTVQEAAERSGLTVCVIRTLLRNGADWGLAYKQDEGQRHFAYKIFKAPFEAYLKEKGL